MPILPIFSTLYNNTYITKDKFLAKNKYFILIIEGNSNNN